MAVRADIVVRVSEPSGSKCGSVLIVIIVVIIIIIIKAQIVKHRPFCHCWYWDNSLYTRHTLWWWRRPERRISRSVHWRQWLTVLLLVDLPSISSQWTWKRRRKGAQTLLHGVTSHQSPPSSDRNDHKARKSKQRTNRQNSNTKVRERERERERERKRERERERGEKKKKEEMTRRLLTDV